MKPCWKNRKRIAWLAVEALGAPEAAALREHLANCDGCRGYWNEIVGVRKGLETARPEPDVVASESFHQRVAERLRATVETHPIAKAIQLERRSPSPLPSPPGEGEFFDSHRIRSMFGWIRDLTVSRWAVAAGLGAVIAAIIVMAALRHPTPSSQRVADATPNAAGNAVSESDVAPTIGNYQMAANRSLKEFDELLTAEGNKRLPGGDSLELSAVGLVEPLHR